MIRTFSLLAALCLTGTATPAGANFILEPTFEQKMRAAELVVIGTVTATDRGGRDGFGSTATLTVWTTLKGEAGDTLVVNTHSRIEELDPRCCEVGATYMMFLDALPDGGLVSVRGRYGMVRIGGPYREIEIVPEDCGRRRCPPRRIAPWPDPVDPAPEPVAPQPETGDSI